MYLYITGALKIDSLEMKVVSDLSAESFPFFRGVKVMGHFPATVWNEDAIMVVEVGLAENMVVL